MSENREGFGWVELFMLILATMIPLWLHFESKSWTGASEASGIFLYITYAGVAMCGYVALSMYLRSRASRPRPEHNDLSPNYWRDDQF